MTIRLKVGYTFYVSVLVVYIIIVRRNKMKNSRHAKKNLENKIGIRQHCHGNTL